MKQEASFSELRDLLEQRILEYLVKNFPSFMELWTLLICSQGFAVDLNLIEASLIRSMPSQSVCLRVILILLLLLRPFFYVQIFFSSHFTQTPHNIFCWKTPYYFPLIAECDVLESFTYSFYRTQNEDDFPFVQCTTDRVSSFSEVDLRMNIHAVVIFKSEDNYGNAGDVIRDVDP